ncbi:putative membrane protein [Anaplasma phagocytophilum str. ApNP]|nr:putative membrane protein [Anaplasma phagocytophilum str. Webster]KJV67708.1 putative membrane protein [Anaplasma phagocytophilum str. ApNP]KJV83603.1 putative membrane protein [Anaplasma phagocytophilum str. HGE2]KJV99838.1 putative membrane protein [Anaplasma phagocytophilum str. Annie]KJZ99809.1 putative membrane protein [Anaplasma phagocytophilum]
MKTTNARSMPLRNLICAIYYTTLPILHYSACAGAGIIP